MSTIHVTWQTSDAELYHKYQQQTNPQPVYLELDPDDGSMRLDWSGEIGNAAPFAVFHNRILRYYLPGAIRKDPGNALLKAAVPLAERIAKGYNEHWDGNNMVGKLDSDAELADAELKQLCEDVDSDDLLRVFEAGDWYDLVRDEMAALVKGKSDDEIQAIAEEHEGEAAHEGYYLEGAYEFLIETRDEQDE